MARRVHGEGSIFKLPSGRWRAAKTYYVKDEYGNKIRKTKSRNARTKAEALEKLKELNLMEPYTDVTFRQLYEKWLPTHTGKSKSTIDCYKAAFKYFAPIEDLYIKEIQIDDLQECLDECGKGKRTQENMRAVCGLVYKFGIPRFFVPHKLNLAEYLKVNEKSTGTKEALTLDQLLKIKALNTPASDYIFCACYLGFRPSELLSLQVKDYNKEEGYLIGGSKTEAGINRVVPISPKILLIIEKLVCEKSPNQYIFSDKNGNQLSYDHYRRTYFYPTLDKAKIQNKINENGHRTISPHSTRHTFANLLKAVKAPDSDKLKLIGHTTLEMLNYYQSSEIDELKNITNKL